MLNWLWMILTLLAGYWLIAGNSGEGARFTFDIDPRSRAEAVELVKRFRSEQYDPEGYTIHTYVAIQIWAQAVKKAGTLDSANISTALGKNTFNTALGQLSFDEKGDLVKHSYVWYEWRDGSYFVVD